MLVIVKDLNTSIQEFGTMISSVNDVHLHANFELL